MRRIRFNIASLLVVVLFVAVGSAALRESSDLWESGVFTLTLAVLLMSIRLAVHGIERRRAFWLGFAVFGWIYLALSFMPSIESRLITTKVLAYLDSNVPGRSLGLYTVVLNTGTGSATGNNRVANIAFALDGIQAATSSQGQVRRWSAATVKLLGGWNGTTENFIRIGHSLVALMAGWLGGQISGRLRRASRAPEPLTAVNVEGNYP
jgi:hypothetical protein